MSTRTHRPLSVAASALALLALACADGATSPRPADARLSRTPAEAAERGASQGADRATATLRNAAGEEIGFARFVEDARGRVHLTVHAKGLSEGLHGMHLHAVGSCVGGTTPAFSSAGGHFNPTGHKHGYENPQGYHRGDLPNLVVNEAGVGRLSVTIEQFRLADLFDANGTALVVHQNEDDFETDAGPLGPGNSGPRVACGALAAS